MSRLLRIAYAVPTLGVGGAEVQLLHLLQGLRDEFELTLILTRHEGAMIGDARRAGVYTRVLDARSGWDPRQYPRARRVFRQHTPHILHTFLFGFDYWVNRAARAAGVPVVVSSRREIADWQRPRHRWFQRLANRHATAIVANSAASAAFAREVEGAPSAMCHVIRNGIAAASFRSEADPGVLRRRFELPAAKYIVGMVANFSPVKDHPLFVAMAEELLRRRDDLHFLLVGSGSGVQETMRGIARRGLAKRFTRLSTASEMAEILRVIDVAVLTSKTEGAPNALAEAMAAGKPVVAAAVGGVPELVADGVTGRLVQGRDPRAFAEAVAALLDDPAERARLGDSAAAWVANELPVDRMVGAYRQLYRGLLSETRRASAAAPAGSGS